MEIQSTDVAHIIGQELAAGAPAMDYGRVFSAFRDAMADFLLDDDVICCILSDVYQELDGK